MHNREYPKLGVVSCPYPRCKSTLFREEIIVHLIFITRNLSEKKPMVNYGKLLDAITCVLPADIVLAKCPNCQNTWEHDAGKIDYNLKDDKGNKVSKYYKANSVEPQQSILQHPELDV